MSILKTQLDFYKKRKAGCIFAALVAKDPEKYSWKHHVLNTIDCYEIDLIIDNAINNKEISTISIIFPNVKTSVDLILLLKTIEECNRVILERDIVVENNKCLGYRVKVGNELSWVSGFGNFDFLPKTRQAPHTEIVFRVAPRPHYEWYMKPPIKGVIHLADMDMLGVPKRVFKKWWNASLRNTKKVLGHPPNSHSAAKTTFSIPIELFKL